MPSRLQSSLALSSDGAHWIVVNASPDLTTQIGRHLPATDTENLLRASTVSHVFLTNADLDHSLGLLLLREGGCLAVTAPDGARDALTHGLRFDAALQTFGGLAWNPVSEDWTPIANSGLEVRAIPLPDAEPPRYAPEARGLHGVGYLFREGRDGTVCGIFPDLARLDESLLDILASCAHVYLDGTFWDEDEMPRLGLSPRGAREMGHLPVSDSLVLLSRRGIRAAYLHVNNTNPILRPDSEERWKLEQSGLRLAEDGERLSL